MKPSGISPPLDERSFAVDVVKKLRDSGYEALFAGGCVRDEILGLTPSDYDVATSATPEQVLRIFPRSLGVGAAFGVVEILGPRGPQGPLHVQVATFRTDGPYLDGRRPTSVHFGSAREDALRRDFTINGMFLDPITDSCIDYVEGKADLKARVVRAIGSPADRFGEDKLRILRAVRMAARFGFSIEKDTWEAILANAQKIHQVSPERITEELRKILSHPTRLEGVQLLLQSGLFQEIMGQAFPLPDSATLAAIGHLPVEADFPLVVSLFTNEKTKLESWGEAMRLSRSEINLGVWLVSQQDTLGKAHLLPNSVIFPLLAHPDHASLLLRERVRLQALGQPLTGLGRCHERLTHPPPEGLNPPPLLTGNDLKSMGMTQGPAFSRILKTVRAAQLDQKIQTTEDAETLAANLYQKMSKENPDPPT